jgi:glycosyltransferase involved in cell wall biosynthesis
MVVPYGVDLQQFSPGQGSNPEHVVIGAASRLSPEKGIRYLIEAFALLRQRYGGHVSLRIAGDGPERPRIEAMIEKLNLETSVELRGWVEHDQLPAFLRELDVFVLPSTWEGFGVSAIEASAVELPVVASDIHGIPDAVRDGVTGLLVQTKQPGELADAIGRLVESPALRAALGKAGRAYVAQHYDWTKNAAQMAAIYDRLAELSPARRRSEQVGA